MLKTSKELVEYVCQAGEKRILKPFPKLALASIISGMLIAFGSVGYITVTAKIYFSNTGIAKILGALFFPVGIIAIVILGFELFTSNCMMTIGVIEKKYSLLKMLKVLGIILFFNFIGSLIIVFITYKTHTLSESGIQVLTDIAQHKVEANGLDIFLKGILCNVIVAIGSLLGYAPKDGISKIFAMWFPIALFVILGYDHIVANMLYLPLAFISGIEGVTISGILNNFLFSTLGNFVGGGIIIALSMWYLNKD